jgi:uncharacterized membrane protein YfcA
MRNRPRILFDALFVMQPSILLGSFIGVFLTPLFPNDAITMVLSFFLIILLVRTTLRVCVFFF